MSRPSWTISDAADRVGVSRSTIRRYREAGKFPHAFKDSGGVWKVPLEDLLALDLRPVDPALSVVPEPVEDGLTERVRELESALAVERARNEGLQRLAAAAEANAADLRLALRMLESGPVAAQNEPVSSTTEQVLVSVPERGPEPAEQPSERAEQPRRRWWRR